MPLTAPAPALDRTAAVRSCESLLQLRPSARSRVRDARVMPAAANAGEWCRVTIEVETPARNAVTVWLALPISHWNGRFLGLGGGGWVAGFPHALTMGAPLGFATAITNAGRPYDLSSSVGDLSRDLTRNFLRDAEGRLDWPSLQNFAYRGVHEMTVVGKAVTTEFYGAPPRYSYFSGCSTGGRQGQAEVQRYPNDYDGVVSGAPAINWAHFAASEDWARAVMNELRPVAQCKFDAAHRAAVAACDGDDGVRDGLVARLDACRFDPKALVGTQTDCGVIDQQDAEVIRRIWEGPRRADSSRLWNGVDRAALIHAPEPWDAAIFGPPLFETASEGRPEALSFATFEQGFDQFVERYGAVMDTSTPDLAAFAGRGGKTILWHGVADDIIPAAGTVRYVESVRRTLGARAADNFLRFYLTPGVRHCVGGDGPPPIGLLEPLMDWVERGRAPEIVRSENWDQNNQVTRTRPLCPYPQYARYRGRGAVNNAASFRCTLPD